MSGLNDACCRLSRVRRADGQFNFCWPGTRTKYGYDQLDRLTSATSSSSTQGWTYDANGNRLTETGDFYPSTYSISPTSNQIAEITGALAGVASYDAAGNLTSVTGSTYNGYNARGRLSSVTYPGGYTESLIYDAFGRAILTSGVSANESLFYDQAGHLLGEYDLSGNIMEETVWSGDIPVATLRPNGSGGVDIYYVHADHLNTPRAITRASDNAIVWQWNSDPFGYTAPDENPSGLGTFLYNLRFPGQLLVLNGARTYDAIIGGYDQSDPIGLKGGLNTYSYARENPEFWIDPPGLASCPGGEWSLQFGGASFSVAFGGYFGKGRSTYTCKTNPSVKCSASSVCIGGGAIAGAGLGWDLYGFLVGASDSSDLLGWSGWQVVGNVGPVNMQAPPGGGISANAGPSIGAGLAAVKCYTYAMICSSGHCGRSN